MKTKLILLFAIFVSTTANAQDTIRITSLTKNVIVYREGAMVTNVAEKFINKGKTVLVFTDLSNKLDKNTIRIKPDNDITIVSVSHKLNYLNKKNSAEQIVKLENQLSRLKDGIELQNRIIEVLLTEKKLLLTNMSIG